MASRVLRTSATAGIAGLSLLAVTSCGEGGADEVRWGYEGAEGPANWATLAEDFESCEAGREQSPIDLDEDAAVEVEVEVEVDKAITIDYGSVTAEMENNGHSVQANVSPGSKIVIGDTPYDLVQFHFHLPSEHTEDGEHADMELHFVHADKDGDLAVVGVLMEAGDDEESPFADLWRQLPHEGGDETWITEPIDLTAFLPGDRDQYRYDGSLTTPPCTEGVKWTVLEDPINVSPDEVAAYQELFPKSNRPVQPLNDRELAHADD